EQLSDLLNNAQANLTAAEAEPDPAQRRLLLEETRRLANEALRIDETNANAEALRVEATTALDRMNAVFDLTPLTSLAILSATITGNNAIEGLTVNGGQAYMLDTAGGRVMSMPADGSSPPVVLFQDGATYGGTPARAPIEFTWEGGETDGR